MAAKAGAYFVSPFVGRLDDVGENGMDLIKTIPPDIEYFARNPAKNVQLGGPNSIFVPMTGAPYMRDLDDVRRGPTIADLGTFHKLAHMMPALHSSAHHIVEPMDIVVAHRHLHITYSSMKHSDKIFMGMTTSPKNAEDVLDMCEILFGKGFMETHAVTTGNCNGNSPLVWDQVMLGAMRAFCRRNQPVLEWERIDSQPHIIANSARLARVRFMPCVLGVSA